MRYCADYIPRRPLAHRGDPTYTLNVMRDIPNNITSSSGRGHISVGMALSDSSLLRNEVAVEAAIRGLESYLGEGTNVEHLINDLLSIPHLFEFVMSAVANETFLALKAWIIQHFPAKPEDFATSIVSVLLSRLSLSLVFLPYSSSAEEPGRLKECRRSVELALAVLQAIPSLVFADEVEVVDDDLDEFQSAFLVRRRTRSKKQVKRATRRPIIDRKPFDNMQVSIPSTKEEADELASKILEDQGDILQYYLEIFRYPQLTTTFKKAYLPQELSFYDASTIEEDDNVEANTSLANDDIPAAYPMVQPMKAALYFDSADGFGEWRILISTRADRDLRQARKKDAKIFRIIIKKIRELSKGHFSDDNQKRLTGLEVEVPIYEAKMTRDSRLVYQVDCIPEFESDVERQVLRIFGIYTHAQLDHRFWDCMGQQLGRKGKEYRQRCVFRNKPVNAGDNVIMPASFPPPSDDMVLSPSGIPDLRKEDLEELHSLLVLEKFVTFSQALLNSILADQDVAHVFDVSPQEKKIIEHTSSCYVLGRSGTGKTTTMLFKMLGIERSWEAYRDAMPKPRQLFVTQSRVLAEKVEEYFAKLIESLATANQSPKELINIAATKKNQQEQGLVDRDEEIYWRGDLPKRYSELKDEHFPMFVTFDHLCRLLEAEMNDSKTLLSKREAISRAMQEDVQAKDALKNGEVLSNDYMQQQRASFVSFGTFLEAYWSHFPQSLTKGLDPTLVFGEFMGVIKGSEQTLKCGEGYLDKDAYYTLSHRSQATFSNQRDAIYKLFQAYLKRKRERGDYDAADRTHAILDGLRVQGVPGKEVDFIYVDEAQDNLLIDALVLRSICRNPNGLFWAGDTAQTISVGSAFRFNDLKAFLYRVEEANAGPHAESQTQPQSFQLTVNYRSHAGIVSCAHSVVELITEFWPHAIDALGEEKGMIDGLKPVFFSGWDQNTVRYEQFLFGESGSHIEFGAQQCILVRDDAARIKLREQVGDIGLIMTLYESKGLEFNDVLLYNFFEDSTVDLSQWRVVLNALPERECGKHPAPRFDDTRHSGVCRELKFLYVAITRARKNLWIADCSEKGEPMRVFWTARNQLQNCTPGTDVPRLAMSSSAEDWAKTALSLFNNRRYLQAMHCYERAGLPREKAVARAYYLREQARATPVIPRSDGIAQSTAFIIAAEAFLKSAEQAVKERRAYYRIAAECYVLSGDDRKAGQAYLSALEFTLSAQHFRKAGRFDEAVKVIKAHRSEMTHTVADSIVDVSRLYYLSKQKVKEARELFESDEDALEYMDDYGLDIARATLLEELGRFADAAELHLAEGHTLDAIRLFLADQQNSISVRRAYQCLLDGLWRHLSCGIMFHSDSAKANVTLQELLRLSAQLNHASSDENSDDEMSMFRAIASSDLARLLQLGEKFYLLHHNMAAAFLCMDHVFSTMPKLQAASLSQIATKLQTFLSYAQMLQKFVSDSDLCNNKTIRKLFGFEASTEELFLIPKETSLFTQINDRLTPTARSTDEGSIVVRWELERLIGFFLRGRLLRRVIQENEMCHTLRAFRPCLPFIIFRHCNRQECPRDHVDPAFYDANAYNNRVRVHLQQILIYQTLHAVENGAERDRQKRDWLRQLYDALFPPHYKMGSLHLLATAMIPEFQKGLQVVRTWVPELFYALDPYAAQHQFLSSLTRAAALSYTFDSYAAHHYIRRANCYSMYRPPHLLRSPDAYVVHDILAFMEDNHQNSLSRGILFMKHVLDNQIPIDIAVLCDFLDHLCGSLVISVRFQRDSTLHDVTLPRSWLVREVRAINKAKLRDTGLSFVYVKSMTALLEQIYTGLSADYLLFERRALSNLGFQIKNVFFARICRNLCLLGYNIRTWSLKNEIFRIITSVRKPNRQFNPLIESYVTARSWEYLARTVRSSVTGSPLDEMIQLHDATRMVRNMELPNVRRIVYKHLDEIPGLLNSGGLLLSKTVLRGEALPFVPTRPGSANVASGDQTNELLPVSADVSVDADPLFDDDEGNDDIIENTVNVDDIAQAIDAGQTTSAPAAPTEAEVAAANAIQVAYRQYLARRRTTTKTTLHEMRRRIFTAFQEASHTMQWPHKYYRFLYLGPLPHLLVCLECMQNHIHTAKNHARKRFMVVQHIELENAQAAFSVWAGLLKDVVRLQKLLGPKSEFHVGRDLVQLKARVVEVEQLMHSVPSGPPLEWQEDMKIAVKGIVKTKQLPVKEVKPELNVEDVLEDY